MSLDKIRIYLYTHPLVIVDSNQMPRSHLRRIVLEMGANPERVFCARDGAEAVVMIAKHLPRTVICDDSIGLEDVMRVSREHRKQTRAGHEQIFFLISGNTSQAVIGRAAEEEVDGFILKPYTKTEFIRIFNWVAQEKLNPTDYQKQLNLGRDFLFSGALDEAISHFEKAKTLHENPAMAHFYIGQALQMKKAMGDAQASFRAGMLTNQVHCKCLLGMFDVLVSESRAEEAYEVLRRIVALFPANPQRLSTAVNMAVRTGNFRDVENYYDFFVAMDQGSRTEDLKNQMGSALAVNGRYHLIRSSTVAAIQSFERAIISGDGQEKFIDYALKTLLHHGLYDEATAFAMKHAPAKKPKAAA